MTDTVSVPREPTPDMWSAGERAFDRDPDLHHETVLANVWSAMLAAATKTEPVSDHQDIEDLIADAIGDSIDMDWTSRDGAKAVVKALEEEGLTISAHPEAPKAEQEPVAWRYRSAERPHLGWTKPEYSRRSPCGRIGMDEQPLFTHPAPASNELLEALKPFADAAEDLDDGETGHIWERPAAMSIDASDLRRAYELYAKHKGPQS